MTQESIQSKAALFDGLPPEWPKELMPEIQTSLAAGQQKIVVLDDDPTGTQTVHGVPVLTTWSSVDLARELKGTGPGFFILTNSRSLDREGACALGREIGTNLGLAAWETGIRPLVISRSDSTLRGHFPHEVDAVSEAMGDRGLPFLIFPFFPEGGRYTIGDIHYVAEGDDLVPAGQTPYARDAAFGFSASNLREWVGEKTQGAIPAGQVVSVSLADIREGGPERVYEILKRVQDNSACIVNAVSYRDVEVVAAALFKAMADGRAFQYRTAAAFVRVMAGISPKPDFLSRDELTAGTARGGLFLVGSYVPKTTAQVEALINQTPISPVEIRVDQLLEDDTREAEIRRTTDRTNDLLGQGKDVVVFTSRTLVRGADPKANLDIGGMVSQSLVRLVQGLTHQPRYLAAKGGITSSDTATKGLSVKRAMVMGQALPGIPVWRLGSESKYPGMPYIVFPGNVGDDTALADICQRLSQEAPC